MVPTMILVGVLLGLLPLPEANRTAVVAGGSIVAAVGWGLLVGVPVGGTVVGLVNVVVGVLLGAGLLALTRTALR